MIPRRRCVRLSAVLVGMMMIILAQPIVAQSFQIKVTRIQITPAQLTITKANTLTVSVQPSNATNKTVTWSSNLPSVATVNQYGNVVPVNEGACTITATANDGSGAMGTCTIQVRYFTYTLNALNATITGYAGTGSTLTIPSTLDGFGVTEIGDRAFQLRPGFTGSLSIPDSVTRIGNSAFEDCFGLSGNLHIGSSVASIGDWAFDGCTGLNGSLLLPDSLVSIGTSAFGRCKGFHGSLTLPSHLSSIADSAFYSCSGFTGSLIIPAAVTNIQDDAFMNCSHLDKIYINSVSYHLGNNALHNSAPIFYGYSGTPAQTFAADSGKTFIPFSINITGVENVLEGDTIQLFSGAELPPYALLVWSSSNEMVAKVSHTGLVTGVSPGIAIISSTWGNLSDTHTIQVNAATAMTPGDANADGSVDILDLVAVIDYIVSGTPCASMANADANNDDTVDIMDLVWIIDKIVG